MTKIFHDVEISNASDGNQASVSTLSKNHVQLMRFPSKKITVIKGPPDFSRTVSPRLKSFILYCFLFLTVFEISSLVPY